MPTRTWGDEPVPEPARPHILVSSRDGAPVPQVGAIERLVKAAEAAGWTVVPTYALAAVPDRHYLNGNLAKPAHALASIAVWFARDGQWGWAVWHNEDDQGWRFIAARVGHGRCGARDLAARLKGDQ